MTLLHRYLASSYIKMFAISQNRPVIIDLRKAATLRKTKLLHGTGRKAVQWSMSNVLKVSLETTIYSLAQRGCSQRRIAKDLGVNRERWAGICGCRNQPFRSPAIYQEAGDWSRWPPYSKRSSSRNSGLTFPFCLKCERDRRYEFRNAWRARSSGEDTSTNAAICRIPRLA
jgi:hypothetical protein